MNIDFLILRNYWKSKQNVRNWFLTISLLNLFQILTARFQFTQTFYNWKMCRCFPWSSLPGRFWIIEPYQNTTNNDKTIQRKGGKDDKKQGKKGNIYYLDFTGWYLWCKREEAIFITAKLHVNNRQLSLLSTSKPLLQVFPYTFSLTIKKNIISDSTSADSIGADSTGANSASAPVHLC